jgi:hypothetical protein
MKSVCVLRCFYCLTLAFSFFIIESTTGQASGSDHTLWQIGKQDGSSAEFALAPSEYKRFLEKDFGWEDGFYLIGKSTPEKNWPYILPGPGDGWAGTTTLAGWRSHLLTILFPLNKMSQKGDYKLIINILDTNPNPPLFKVTVNGNSWEYQLPKGSGNNTFENPAAKRINYVVEVPVENGLLREGGNEIELTSIWGCWLIFDQVRLEGPKNARIPETLGVFVRNVNAGNYEMNQYGNKTQPLLVDVQHVEGDPELEVLMDGKSIFKTNVEEGRHVYEAPMAAVTSATTGRYEIKIDGKQIQTGIIDRSPQKMVTPADYVDTKIGTAHSRWMIAPGPWMPFSMVKLSPDNQNQGWQAGYDPIFPSISGFSHIHEWTMAGLSMMPTNGTLMTEPGDQAQVVFGKGYRSRFDQKTEEAPIGYYRAHLTDYDIIAELTATTRCSFQRYTFPKRDSSRVLIDFNTPGEYSFNLEEINATKVSDYRIEGFSKHVAHGVWFADVDQEYIIHFVIEFDQLMKAMGSWNEQGVQKDVNAFKIGKTKKAGVFVQFNTAKNNVVKVRTGISYVSTINAGKNLETEISKPYGWNFEAVRAYNVATWNDLFGRVKITTSDRREKVRFYSNMYRTICSRNTYSDVDGSWVDATEKVQKLIDPDAVALGCDAFWNTFWNLNQFWNLVTPEWSSRWVKSQLAMYETNGWLAKGPAGMEYIPVMVAEHEIPLMVSAYQMGIRNYDVEKVFEAIKKMQTTPPQKIGGGIAGNADLVPYLKYK